MRIKVGSSKLELRRALQTLNATLKKLKRPIEIYRFIGDGTRDEITVPAYVPGSAYVVVNGQAIRLPGVHYDERKDVKGYYTIIIDNGSHAEPVFPKDRACDFVYTPFTL